MSDKPFAVRVNLMSRAIRMMKDLQVEVQGGHLIEDSLMVTVAVADFDRLVELGQVADVTIEKTSPLDQISFHSTATNKGVLTGIPEVRVMAISITPIPVPYTEEVRAKPTTDEGTEPAKPAEDDSWPIPF